LNFSVKAEASKDANNTENPSEGSDNNGATDNGDATGNDGTDPSTGGDDLNGSNGNDSNDGNNNGNNNNTSNDDKPASTAYSKLEGTDASYTQGSNASMTFHFDAPYENLVSVAIDDKVLDAKYYTVESGSTIIKVAPEYLATLDAGQHTLTALYSDGGVATADFVINKSDASASFSTNDDNSAVKTASDTNNAGTSSNDQNAGDNVSLASTGDQLTNELILLFCGVLSSLILGAVSLKLRKLHSNN
jgi:hypothetical protein